MCTWVVWIAHYTFRMRKNRVSMLGLSSCSSSSTVNAPYWVSVRSSPGQNCGYFCQRAKQNNTHTGKSINQSIMMAWDADNDSETVGDMIAQSLDAVRRPASWYSVIQLMPRLACYPSIHPSIHQYYHYYYLIDTVKRMVSKNTVAANA